MLARQLLIGFLAVLVPTVLLLGGVTAYSLLALSRLNAEIVEIARSREAVGDLQVTVTQLGAPLGAYLLAGGERNRERFETLIGSAETKLTTCATAACHGSTASPRRMVAALAPAVERLKVDGRLIFETDASIGQDSIERVRQAVLEIRGAFQPMLVGVRARAEQLEEEADWVRRRAWGLTVSLTVLVALGGFAASTVIARQISRPLSALVLGIRRIMAGDWGYQVSASPKGEIGELASWFNRMVTELNRHRVSLEDHNRALEERVRQRTEELRDKEHALAQSEKLASLGLLAAGVAHELNNPLTSIMMNANLLAEDAEEGSPLHKDLKRIDADAGRCRRIIDDLRAFARLRQVHRTRSDVATMVEQAATLAAHELARRQAVLRCELAPDLSTVTLDADRIVQVLTNLLVNAAQAVRPNGQVVLRARRDEGHLALEVEDDGPGIPEEDRGRIFDPFFTTKPDGTGLGLSITYGLVDEHGGRIEVRSRTAGEVGPGGQTGTIMRVILPIPEAAA